jgi:hypothetical protein
MALDKALVPLTMGIGIDTKTDPKQVIAAKLLSLQNCVFGTGGEFNKRNGYQSLNHIIQGNALAAFQNQLIGLDGASLYSYSEAQSQFNSIGTKVSVDIERTPLVNEFVNVQQGDLAYNNGYYGMICNKNNIIIIDSVTGQQILNTNLPNTITGLGYLSRTQILGTKFIFVFSTATEIGYVYVDTTNPTVVSAPVTLFSNYGGFCFDCQTINGNLCFVYGTQTNTINFFYLNSSLVLSSGLVCATTLQFVSIGMFSDTSNNIWVGYSQGGDAPGLPNNMATTVYYFIVSSSLTSLLLVPTLIDMIAHAGSIYCPNVNGCYNGTNGQFFYEIQNSGLFGVTDYVAPELNYIKTEICSVAGAIIYGPASFLQLSSMYSKPFFYSNQIYMVISYGGNVSTVPPIAPPIAPIWSEQSTFFLVNQSGQVVAKFAVGNANNIQNKPMLTDVVNLGGGQFTLAFDEVDRIDIVGSSATNNSKVNGIEQMTFTFFTPMVTNKLGNNLHIGTGLLTMFDGVNTVEHGFNVFPELVGGGFLNTDGNIAVGTYQYCVVYEWVDAQGQLHQSAPSVPITVTTPEANANVEISFAHLILTYKTAVSIVIYRTQNGLTQFYQVSPSLASGVYIPNDPTTPIGTFIDGAADADIIGNNQLYTNGGEFENIEIPATSIIWQYANRLMGVYSESPTTIGFSKQIVSGQFPSPVEFTDTFTIVVPEQIQYVSGGIQMDDKCIIFGPNYVYYMTGQGPSANGQNNDFSTPLLISSDAGCIDNKSIVLTPLGVMFKSTKGIYLLDRSLQVEYIGAPVEEYNSATITSVQMVETYNQVRFSLNTGIVLVYDYYFKQWGTFTNIAAVDSCIFQGLYTYLQAGGNVFQETPGVYTDNGAFIPMGFTTSWFSFAKIQGFQRVYSLLVLGQWISPHTMQYQFNINFNSNTVQTVQVPVLSQLTPYQYRIFPQFQKEQSYQLVVLEQQSSPFGQGLSLSDFTFEVGLKKGHFKLPAAQSYG